MSATTGVKPQARNGGRRATPAGAKETEVSLFARASAAFSRVAAAADEATEIDDLLRVVARQLRDLIGVERCTIALRVGTSDLFRGCVGSVGDQNVDVYVKRALAGMPADGMTCELVETKKPVIITNANTDPRVIRATVRFWNIRSIMAVPLVYHEEVIGVIYLDDVDRPHTFSDDDASLASMFGSLAAVAVMNAQAKLELNSRLEVAERQIQGLRRVTALHERLSDMVAMGCSLHELTEALAGLLGKPCAVHDANHVQLAVARPPGARDDVLPRLLERPAVDTPEVQEALASNPDSRAFIVGPLASGEIRRRYLVAPIVIESAGWGHLVVAEHNSRFSGADMLILRRAATLVALQMSTERKALEADWNAGASLAAELLTGSSDHAAVRRRADRLGISLDAPHVVALMDGRERSGGARDFRAVAAAFHAVAPETKILATSLDNRVSLVIEVPKGIAAPALAERLKRLVERVWDELGCTGDMVAGISSVCEDLEGYSSAYCEAQQVIECIRRFGTPDGPAILAAQDLGAGLVFLATCDPAIVLKFADETFGELARDPSKADLLVTLRSFFDNMASIRRCALRLGVHENTIRYRLGRIEELTRRAVTHDPDGQLGARLSLLVLMLQNRLPAARDGSDHDSAPTTAAEPVEQQLRRRPERLQPDRV